MPSLYGFPVTEARRRVPLFHKLTEMQEPPSEVARRKRVAAQRELSAAIKEGTSQVKRFQRNMPKGKVRLYPGLKEMGL